MQKQAWSIDDISGWFAGRVPNDWFTTSPVVRADREEILVTGELPDPTVDDSDDQRQVARLARIESFREASRERRMAIARDAEALWGRKVSWGARCGDVEVPFTTASVPVMTRLRMQERAVLDTFIDAGVARSRSEALAWCVRLVSRHQQPWIDQLRGAVATVERARSEGPDLS